MINWLKKIFLKVKGIIPACGDVGFNIKPELKVADTLHHQVGGTTNITGLTYTEAKDLFLILFKQNFPILRAEAMSVCEERITIFEKEFFEKSSQKISGDKISKFADPDIQNDCNEITKIVVTKNDTIINSLLIEILTNKINNDDELQNIASSEAKKVAGKLTETQLRIILLAMIVIYTTYSAKDVVGLEADIKELLEKLKIDYIEYIDIDHLAYTGCINKVQFRKNFNDLIHKIYDDIIPEMRNIHEFSKYPSIRKLQDLWDNKNLKLIELTSVGKVVAINYYKILFNDTINDTYKIFQRNQNEEETQDSSLKENVTAEVIESH